MQQFLSFVFGLVFVGFGIHLLHESLQFRRDGVRTEGTVVELESRLVIDEDGVALMRRPVVEFQPAAADSRAAVRFASTVSTSWPWSHAKGDRVTVVYLKGEPGRARIDGLFGNWIAPIAFLLIGAWVAIKRPALSSSRETSFDID